MPRGRKIHQAGCFSGSRPVPPVMGRARFERKQWPMPPASRLLKFDDFRFDMVTRELLRLGHDGAATPISLGSRAAMMLDA
jgi:hypothetical protein